MLFNKSGKGSLEIYEIAGNFPASTPFESIKNEVLDAEKIVGDLVGTEIMKAAQAAYDNENQKEGKQLIDAIRRPVACLAVQMHSQLSGVSHGEGGRKIKVDENEKIPFEWMIDRDDKAMKERYYRALDGLFHFLSQEENRELWDKCPLSATLSSCIVRSVSQFETIYPIDGSHYTFYKILPLMIEAQDSLQSKTGWNPEQMSANKKAVKYVVLSALATALKRWSIVIFPQSIARQFAPSYQGNRETSAATMKEISFAADNFLKDANDTLQTIRQAISPTSEAAALLPDNDPKDKFFTA